LDFCSLQHLLAQPGRFCFAGLPMSLRRAARRVWLPSRRITRLNLADRVSDRQRSWDSPFGAFSAGNVKNRVSAIHSSHLPFQLGLMQTPVKAAAGGRVRRFLGLRCPHPWRPVTCLVRPAKPDAPMGFPFQGRRTLTLPGFRPGSARAFHGNESVRPNPVDASAYLSISAGCRRSSSGRCTGDTTLIGFLHRYGPCHSNDSIDPGYEFT